MTLEERMRALGAVDDLADWRDVLDRAGVRPRRLPRVAIALVVVAALLVPTAVAFRGRILEFSGADTAPPRIERDFASLNQGFIGRKMPEVLEDETRKVVDVDAPHGERRVLWVAPRHDGGFCWLVEHIERRGRREGMTGGCGGREGGRMHAEAPRRARRSGAPLSIDVTGRVRDRSIERIELVHEDAAVVELPIVWVSEPIGLGFFLYAVPLDRLERNRPREVVALDADGDVVKREPLRLDRP